MKPQTLFDGKRMCFCPAMPVNTSLLKLDKRSLVCRLLSSFHTTVDEITIIATPETMLDPGQASKTVQIHSYQDSSKGEQAVSWSNHGCKCCMICVCCCTPASVDHSSLPLILGSLYPSRMHVSFQKAYSEWMQPRYAHQYCVLSAMSVTHKP